MHEANKRIMKYSMNDYQNILSTLLFLLFKYIYVCMHFMHMPQHPCGNHRAICGSQKSPFHP